MLYQIDKRIKATLRDDECYAFTVLKIFEDHSKYQFTPKDVMTVITIAEEAGYMGEKNNPESGFMNKNAVSGIATICSGYTGIHVYMKQVTNQEKYNHVIAEFLRTEGNKKFTHFPEVSMENMVDVIYDPYSPNGSRTVREGKIIGYRYIYAERLY